MMIMRIGIKQSSMVLLKICIPFIDCPMKYSKENSKNVKLTQSITLLNVDFYTPENCV
jgi:hypothetical protein